MASVLNLEQSCRGVAIRKYWKAEGGIMPKKSVKPKKVEETPKGPEPLMGPEFKGARYDSQYRRYPDGKRVKVDV